MDSIVRDFQMRRIVPSVSLTVLRDGQVYLASHYGTGAVQNTTDQLQYGLGSIKKTATAAAVLYLAAEGALDLDEPIETYAKSVTLEETGPSVLQVLRHTSGFPQSSDDEPVTEITFEPGTEWEYNNANFDKLDEVILAVAERSFEDVLTSDLNGVGLGMCESLSAPQSFSRGHRVERSEPVPVSDPCWFFGSTRRLAEWGDGLLRGKLLPTEELDRMVEPTVLRDGRVIPFGAGISLRPLRDIRRWSNSGHDTGFTAALGHYPDHGLTIAVAGNSEGLWDPDALEMAVAATLLDLDPLDTHWMSEPQDIEGGVFESGAITFELGAAIDGVMTLTMSLGDPAGTVLLRTTLRQTANGDFVGLDSPEAVQASVQEGLSGRRLELHIVGAPWTAHERR